jgi:uncharacterized protein
LRGRSGIVEQTICGNTDLSALDLSLFKYLDELRRGVSTTRDRGELRDIQRTWIQQRDAECMTAANIKTCLTAKYREQRDKLDQWVPKG